MSYQVLARKWRPSNFSQVAGQAHVLKSLINALDNQRLHHAYLFTGTRGVGKTTLARILAKCLNCEEGITSKPCEKCSSCIEITEGRFIDLMEVDAASRTKVEDTRELLDNVQYTPARGRFKVYLIDEVHMLSTHSFNALLKTLEEPPEHVKFLFATTDPHKLPITILSRCLQFNLKNLSPQLITDYLASVLKQENIEFEQDAIWQIAAAGAGSMRDALTLTDQAISYCEGNIRSAGVVEMLGIPEQQQVFALLSAMEAADAPLVLNLVKDLSEQSPDYFHTLDSLLSVLHRIALAQVLPDAVDNSFGDKEQILELAAKLTAEDVQLYYQMGLTGRDELGLAGEIRMAFEMLILRMMVFSPRYIALQQNGEAGLSSAESMESTGSTAESTSSAAPIEKKKNEQPVTAEPALETETIDDSLELSPELQKDKVDPASENASAVESADVVNSDQQTSRATDPATSPGMPIDSHDESIEVREQKEGGGEEAKNSTLELEGLTHSAWLACYSQLNASGIAANVLANSELKSANSEGLHFILDKSQSAVYSEDLLPKLTQLLSSYFNKELEIVVEIGEVNEETASQLYQRLRQERHLQMVSEFETDENVQELVKHFSGTIAKESISPLKD